MWFQIWWPKIENYIEKVKNDYAEIRSFQGKRKAKTYLTLEQARQNKFQINWNDTPIYKPNFLGVKQLIDYPLEELRNYIDWTFFFLTWGLKGHYPQILNDEKQGEAAKKLYAEANEFLDEIIEKKMLQANAVFGIWPANAEGDDVILYEDESRQKANWSLLSFTATGIEKRGTAKLLSCRLCGTG